jgi:hypothetical protein
MSVPRTIKDATQLREILFLLSTAVEKIASEWEPRLSGSLHAKIDDAELILSHAEHDAIKTVQAAVGSLESLIVEPHMQLVCMATSFTIARALHIAAEGNVAELLSQAGKEGLSVTDLARETGIEEKKLCKCNIIESDRVIYLTAYSHRPYHAKLDIASCLSRSEGRLFREQSCLSSACWRYLVPITDSNDVRFSCHPSAFVECC